MFHSKTNWAGYDQECVLVFMLSTCYSCLILMKLNFLDRISKHTQMSNVTKIRSMETKSFHADRRTDMTNNITKDKLGKSKHNKTLLRYKESKDRKHVSALLFYKAIIRSGMMNFNSSCRTWWWPYRKEGPKHVVYLLTPYTLIKFCCVLTYPPCQLWYCNRTQRGWTTWRHGEANSRFSQYCERA